jgi:methylated-DNA-[protein]-cysteine S-methyltransferase
MANGQETITTFQTGAVVVGEMKLYFISDVRDRIVHLTFDQDGHHRARKKIASLASEAVFREDEGITNNVEQEVNRYVKGSTRQLHLQAGTLLAARATDFQKKVWQQIGRISYGSTRTYGDIARKLGSYRLARAVGQACHANPLALLVPCHRVIGANSIGGFAGGVAIKSRLLALERRFSGAERYDF